MNNPMSKMSATVIFKLSLKLWLTLYSKKFFPLLGCSQNNPKQARGKAKQNLELAKTDTSNIATVKLVGTLVHFGALSLYLNRQDKKKSSWNYLTSWWAHSLLLIFESNLKANMMVLLYMAEREYSYEATLRHK